jgi:hypothetical protein
VEDADDLVVVLLAAVARERLPASPTTWPRKVSSSSGLTVSVLVVLFAVDMGVLLGRVGAPLGAFEPRA